MTRRFNVSSGCVRQPKAARSELRAADHDSPCKEIASTHEAADERFARSLFVQGIGRTLEVKIASERTELEDAFRLLASSYQARGYEMPSTKLFRYTPFHVLPDTITLVAKQDDRVVATLSLVPDTALLGLPMECIYGPEIGELRRRGLRMAEATSLADRDLSGREFILVFKTFIKVVMQHHVRQGGDTWVITVNPRHRGFYLKVLGFQPLGPCRSYPMVQDHPAEAFLLNVDLLKSKAPNMHQFVFGKALPDQVLKTPAWSAEQVRYFGSHSTLSNARTIRDMSLFVEHFGSPPRWRESNGGPEVQPIHQLPAAAMPLDVAAACR
jgi:hypothetical protein